MASVSRRADAAIAILAGGQSRRMGCDKAMIPIGGVPMLAHVARAARAAASLVLLVGREPPAHPVLRTLPWLLDDEPGLGPMGGLVTVLRYLRRSGAERVLLLGCDMPFLTGEALAFLLEHPAAAPHGLVLRGAHPECGGLELLCSIYALACLDLAEALMRAGERSLRSLVSAGQFAVIDAPAWMVPLLGNLNTPADLEPMAHGMMK